MFVGLFQFSKIKHTVGQDHVNEKNEGVEAFPCQVTWDQQAHVPRHVYESEV